MGSNPIKSCPGLDTILPKDLHFYLFHFLSFPDVSRLRATNHYFRELHSAAQLSLLRSSYVSFLLKEEDRQRPQLDGLLALSDESGTQFGHAFQSIRQEYFSKMPCYTCLEWQPLDLFTHSMKGGLWCKEKDLGQARASERICIPCGFRTGFYQVGKRYGGRFFICLACRKLVDFQGSGGAIGPMWCGGCLGKDNEHWPALVAVHQERLRLKREELERTRQRKKEERARFMREGRIDWGIWRRTGRGMKRRRKNGIAEDQKH